MSAPNSDRAAHRAAQRDALLATLGLAAGVYWGSGRLTHFDPALSGYCAATAVACGAGVYRVSRFWRRPAPAFYGRALRRAFGQPRSLLAAAGIGMRDLGAQRFLARRHLGRWLAHLLLSWGTLISIAVTVPLVWGWLHFEAAGDASYRAVFAGVPLFRFGTAGAVGWMIFHALSLAGIAVALGALYFIGTRFLGDPASGHERFGSPPPRSGGGSGRGPQVAGTPAIVAAPSFTLPRCAGEGIGSAAAATRRVLDTDLAPLLLLLIVALTGLALPVVGQMQPPWLHRAAALAHEAAVIVFLIALPHGKLIHLFIRPLQVGAKLVRAASAAPATCRGCGGPLAPAAQIETIETLLAARGFNFAGHQRHCPPCRRRLLAGAQAARLGSDFQPRPAAPRARRSALAAPALHAKSSPSGHASRRPPEEMGASSA